MFIIRNQQLEDFREAALQSFENEMVEHIKRFFPNHFKAMQEEGTRATIRYGYERAKTYGFSTKRNVCLYLNTMLLLGSNFDIDPLYPWIQPLLKEETTGDSKVRMDRLADTALEVFTRVAGSAPIYLTRACLTIHHNKEAVFQRLRKGELRNALRHLERLFPKKYEVIGEPALRQMIVYGTNRADKYGIWLESNTLIYIAFMFLLGSGFDRDPQFPWAGEVLNDRTRTDQGEKISLLYHKATERLSLLLHNRAVNHV